MLLLFPPVLRLHLLLMLMYEEGGCVGLKAMALHAWSTSLDKRAEADRPAVQLRPRKDSEAIEGVKSGE